MKRSLIPQVNVIHIPEIMVNNFNELTKPI